MSQHIIDSEWSRLAEDDGSDVLEYHDYDVIIGGDQAQELKTTPTSISYSPSVNKVKNITLDVPPLTALEDLTYLGEPITLYIDGQVGFEGEIQVLDSQQKEGEDYVIEARPPGKKLIGSDSEETVNNEVFYDYVSSLVDKFNQYDAEHDEVVGGTSETLTNTNSVGGNVYTVSDNTTGSVSYSSVGSDLSQVTSIYVKAYVTGTNTFTVDIDTSSTTDSRSFQNLDKNRYGEWVHITNLNDVVESYDLTFNLEGDSRLIDWISIVNEDVNRITTSASVQNVATDTQLYSKSGTSLEDSTSEAGGGISFNGSGEPQTRQVTDWAISPFPVNGADDFVNGEAGRIVAGENETEWDDFSANDEMQDWGLYARVKPYEYFVNRNSTHTAGDTIYDDDWSGSATSSTTQVAVEDASVEITGDAEKSTQWLYDTTENVVDTLYFSSQAYLSGTGTIDWIVQSGPFTSVDDQDGYGIEISSGTIYLNRYDAGTTVNLDSASYTRQTSEWFDWEIQINDEGVSATLTDSNASYSLSSNDTAHTKFGEFRVDTNQNHYLDDMLGHVGDIGFKQIELDVTVDGASINSFGLTLDVNYREWGWEKIADYTYISDFPNPLSGAYDVIIRATAGSATGFMISPLTVLHQESEWDTTAFDTTVHEAQGHLDNPPLYSDGRTFDNSIRFKQEVSNENIYDSTVNSVVSTETGTLTDWGPSQVINESDTSFAPPPNATSVTDTYYYPGVQHIVKYTLSSAGTRDTDSPRTGYQRQTLQSFDVTVSTNDLEVIFDRKLADNRLALMNTLAEDSSLFFRWEGNTARIFHGGQETTNVNLRSENITSSVSKKDVYRSCEVIGLHNVRSGTIVSQSVPSFVDDNKVIRSENITSESDAKNRARRFLANHSSVKYKGDIRTMPTFAPLGALVDGSLFNHGKDMVIRSVRYGKSSTTIKLGYDKSVSTELITLAMDTQDTKSRTTSQGMTVPVGRDEF